MREASFTRPADGGRPNAAQHRPGERFAITATTDRREPASPLGGYLDGFPEPETPPSAPPAAAERGFFMPCLRGDPGEAAGLVPGAGRAETVGERSREPRPLGLDHRPLVRHRPTAGGETRHDESGLCSA